MARSALLNVMTQAAMKAGRNLTRDFGEVQNLQVSVKGPAEYVATAERRAEETLFAELSRARADWGFLSERRGSIEGRDPQHRWIVDPLNGRVNFLHGIALFAVSIALERDGQIVAGVVFNPSTDELYSAEKGGGAFLNDRRLRVAARQSLPEAVLGTRIPFLGEGDHARFLFELRHLMAEAGGLRRFGSAALDLAFVAAGRLDGFWDRALEPWSMSAGVGLLRAAGGFATALDGGRLDHIAGDIACGNETIHRALLERLATAGAAYREQRA